MGNEINQHGQKEPALSTEVLRYFHNEQLDQLSYRRNRENQIFSWSNAMLLAITGAVLTGNHFKVGDDANAPATARCLLSFIASALTVYSVNWQMYQRRGAAKHQEIIVSLDKSLGAFDGPDPLFPEGWKEWGKKYITYREHLNCPSKISATMLSGLVAIVGIWINLVI